MKIDLFINDYTPMYRNYETRTINNCSLDMIRKAYRPEHTYILRGEPTAHPKFREILDIFTEKNYVLMTEAANVQPLIGYQGTIPYISFCYDGFQNDQIRGNRNLTNNLIQALNYFAQKPTQLRIEYIISPHNYEWFNVDLQIIKKFMALYPKMKQPYFVIFQDGNYFNNTEYSWVPLTQDAVSRANSIGLLTQKNLDFLNAYLARKEYSCTALQSELVIWYDGTIRNCLSHKIENVIGDLNTATLEEVISSTQPIRDACVDCEYKLSCFMAYHYKDSIYDMEEIKRQSLTTTVEENNLIT